MTHIYDQLLKELGISLEENSYEIGRQLKEKKNEMKALMTSRNSLEENRSLETEIHRINEAEVYYEKLVQNEKLEDKSDGFDYSLLQNRGRKSRRVRYVVSDVIDESASQRNEKLSFEERYNNISELLDESDRFDDGLKQLEKLADDGYVVAQRRMGDIYFKAGITQDLKKTIYWYEKAADNGDNDTGFKLALIYMLSEDLKDDEKMYKWYKKTAESGYAESYRNLGECYADGTGVSRNVKEALKWLGKAAENGNSIAYYRIGEIYRSTEELKDDAKAFEWYKKSAEADYFEAYFRLANCYATGTGTLKDVKEAIKWYEKAASEKNTKLNACLELAKIYQYEEEVKNESKAVYWYEKVAKSGDVNACVRLGCYYKDMRYFPRNVEKAIYWFNKAASEGSIEAVNYLNDLK